MPVACLGSLFSCFGQISHTFYVPRFLIHYYIILALWSTRLEKLRRKDFLRSKQLSDSYLTLIHSKDKIFPVQICE